jgi:hypothetical protein
VLRHLGRSEHVSLFTQDVCSRSPWIHRSSKLYALPQLIEGGILCTSSQLRQHILGQALARSCRTCLQRPPDVIRNVPYLQGGHATSILHMHFACSYSHSIVPGGLLVTSSTTRLTSRT